MSDSNPTITIDNIELAFAEIAKHVRNCRVAKNDRDDVAQEARLKFWETLTKYGELKLSYAFVSVKESVRDHHRLNSAAKRGFGHKIESLDAANEDGQTLDVSNAALTYSLSAWSGGTPLQICIKRESLKRAKNEIDNLADADRQALTKRWSGIATSKGESMRAMRATRKLQAVLC